MDFRTTKLNETSLNDMIARNHRVAIYATDYVEFTNSSPFALDGCMIDNNLGPGVSNEVIILNILSIETYFGVYFSGLGFL